MEPGQFIKFRDSETIYYIAGIDHDEKEVSIYLEDPKERQNNYWYSEEYLKENAEVVKLSFIKKFIYLFLKKCYYKIY